MKTIKSLVSVAALAISGIAAAGSPDAHSVVVRYGDLNLNSQAGVKSLHKRIRNAAESVCSELNSRVLSLRDIYDQCVDQAVSDGVAAGRQSESLEFPQEQRKGRGTRVKLVGNGDIPHFRVTFGDASASFLTIGECDTEMRNVPVSDACIAARAGLIRALARDQLMQPCRQALTSID